MSAVQKIHDRALLGQSAITVLRYPYIPGDEILHHRIRERFKLALAQYPHRVKEVTTDGVLRLYIKCVGVDLTDESFHYFIGAWLKHAVRMKDPTVDLDINDATYCGLRPVSNLRDDEGYYELSFNSKHK